MTLRAFPWVRHLTFVHELGLHELVRHGFRKGPIAAMHLAWQAYLLCRNGMFDRGWYQRQYPDLPPVNALKHFLEVGGREGRSPGPSFDSAFYLQRNPDVARAGLNPAVHFEWYGRKEGRSPLPIQPFPPPPTNQPHLEVGTPSTRFQCDASAAETVLAHHWRADWLPILKPGDLVKVYVHSCGNGFMQEIAELLSAGLAEAGFRAELDDEWAALEVDGWDHDALGPFLRWIVAPHEFFFLSQKGRRVPAEWARGAVVLNVEQLHTDWFRNGLEALTKARAVFDISLQSAAVLAQAGLPAAFLPLGYVPGSPIFKHHPRLPEMPALAALECGIRESSTAPDAPLSERPLDVFFIGYLSPRREDLLQRMAERLARWRCHFVLAPGDQPAVRGKNAVLNTEATIGLAQRSKIVLNLHQSDEPFFEWHRIVLQGMGQRALVITEPATAQTLFAAGEHFLEAPLEELPDLIDWVLGTSDGRKVAEQVRRQAYAQLTERVRLDGTLARLLSPPPDGGIGRSGAPLVEGDRGP